MGEEIDYVRYMITFFPIAFFILILYTLIARFVIRVDVSELKNFNPKDAGVEYVPMTGEQKIALIILFWVILDLCLPSILPKTWILPIFLNKLTVFGQVAVFMVVMYMKRLNYLLDLPSVISADEAEKLQKEAAALKSEAGINDFRRLLLRMNCVIKKTLPMIGGVFVLIRRKGLF